VVIVGLNVTLKGPFRATLSPAVTRSCVCSPSGCGFLFGQAFRVLITKQQNPCHLLGRAIMVAFGYPMVDRARIDNRRMRASLMLKSLGLKILEEAAT
jgi:hypothetical protein